MFPSAHFGKQEFYQQAVKEFKLKEADLPGATSHMRYAVAGYYYGYAKKFFRVHEIPELASGMFVEEMRRKKAVYLCNQRIIRWGFYQLWDFSCVFGQNATRWCLCALGVIIFFANLYLWNTAYLRDVPWSHGGMWASLINLFMSFFISLGTFVTLGAVAPQNAIGVILVSLEAASGALLMGVGLAMLTSRILK